MGAKPEPVTPALDPMPTSEVAIAAGRKYEDISDIP